MTKTATVNVRVSDAPAMMKLLEAAGELALTASQAASALTLPDLDLEVPRYVAEDLRAAVEEYLEAVEELRK